MASISCSVILMISCFRTVGEKNPAIYLHGTGELPSDREPSPILQRIPRDLCDKDIPLPYL